MKLKRLGEFNLIKRISKGMVSGGSVLKGIGDDAAVVRGKGGDLLLFASDMIIEGVHFDLKSATPYRIGRKALNINVSDIAAMGGVPLYATVSIGLPGDLDLKFIDSMYRGLRSASKASGVKIVGGDTVRSDKIVIDCAIIGRTKKSELILRSGAGPGELIMVTGTLGGSIKGHHLDFKPRLREARYLAMSSKVGSMIDISDGLSSDLARICEESGVGAMVYESLIPVSRSAGSANSALNDGEDFELLFTVKREAVSGLVKGFRKRFKTPITTIGEVRRKNYGLKLVNRYGRASNLKERGFRHL